MNALVYHGPGKKSWEEKPTPVLQQPTDAIVKIYKTTICGTDLHILKGDLPEVTDGRILGHEGIGIVEDVGSAVTTFQKGDKVLISCISSCGKCAYCRKGMYSHCDQGGWILGHLIDGTQAEYVRIPFADTSLYHIPEQADDDAVVMLSDILPTGFECGVLNGQVKPGDTVVIVGAGPIGLAVLLTAQFYAPARLIMIDIDDNRLQAAKALGATHTINSQEEDAISAVFSLTENVGADVAVEAVGIPATFELCTAVIAPGGCVANVGVHGKPVELHLETLWSKNITITTRLVDTVTTPMLMKTVLSHKLDGTKLITHHFALNDILQAYDTFEHAAREKALKVILTNE
ncbi:zinc-dependent alcohol dehydrogenase family protein [Spirosoma spitsbergense]|jgi:alcohol dehydrogenase|uniref:zinc-dependent alcohol dehydrogenase family protein n=1 Tax=Spirosoma spitsbergense TaxID=431554 RepID=UPI00037685D8|nr:zinc-dependent alcohol dehydrogenase family protein [Spirosoma spitsbergense]